MSSSSQPQVYLIPSFLDEPDTATLPPSILSAVKLCKVFFVENERSARRFLKILWKEIIIDDYEWHTIHKAEDSLVQKFKETIKRGVVTGIISEAGCPGIADPGQILINAAQEMGVTVRPLVGPNSIILALMASGLNGQRFTFNGYLAIEPASRVKSIKDLESRSVRESSTEIFIETPYRNKQLAEAILQHCKGDTRLCIAINITGPDEFIQTKQVRDWQNNLPDMHKRPAIFLLYARH